MNLTRPLNLTLAVVLCAGLTVVTAGPASAAPMVSTDLNPGTVGASLSATGSGFPASSPVTATLATTSALMENTNGQTVAITPKAGAKIGWSDGKLVLVSGTQVGVTVTGLTKGSTGASDPKKPQGFYLFTAKHVASGVNSPAVGGISESGSSEQAWMTNYPVGSSPTKPITAAGTSSFAVTITSSADSSFDCTKPSDAPDGCDLTLRVDHRQSGNRTFDVKLPLKFVASAAAIPTTVLGSGSTNAGGSATITAVVPAGLGSGSYALKLTSGVVDASKSVDLRVPFWDYKSGLFFQDVAWLRGTGITTGNGKNDYQPNGAVTRQAMAAFLFRLEPRSTAACTGAPFPDVPKSSVFCREIKWLKSSGVTAGYSDGTFRPGTEIDRQAMARFLFKLANPGETPERCTTAPFTDVPANHPFCAEINWMKNTQITTGEGGKYSPSGKVSRIAMAAFLHRFAELP